MTAFRISRAPAASGEVAYDPFAKLVFEPPLESDELFDALRDAYPSLKTHTERKKQAVLDFLMHERQALDQEITAFVQQTGAPVPAADDSYSARPSPVFSVASCANVRKSSTSNSSSSSSTRSAGSSPETLSLKDMTSVWTAAGHGKPKIHTRRSMTTKEKEEYRRRRQMKACKECRSRKRKCNHDPSDASSAASPHTGAKVKKRTSTAAPSYPHPPQPFLSNEIDTSLLDDSSFGASTDSPMDFLDFSPATGTEGSFDDFLLLPNDDFSMDFATESLFQSAPQTQPYSYDPFVQTASHSNTYYAPSAGSPSPASSAYQSSGMSRSASNALFSPAQSFDTTQHPQVSQPSQPWSFDFVDPSMDTPAVLAHRPIFESDGKQNGLAGGVRHVARSPGRTPAATPALSPTSSNFALTERTSRNDMPSSGGSPGLRDISQIQSPLSVTQESAGLVLSPGRTRRESFRSSSEGTSRGSTATLNAYTPVALSSDAAVIPDLAPDWFNGGRRRDARHEARRDGLVLGTDPSASARFGEHGHSLAMSDRGLLNEHGVIDHNEFPQQQDSPTSSGHSSPATRRGADLHDHDADVSLASRERMYMRLDEPNAALYKDRAGNRSSGLSVTGRRHVSGTDHVLPSAASASRPQQSSEIANLSADQAIATSRFCKGKSAGEGIERFSRSDTVLADGRVPCRGSGEDVILPPAHTRLTGPLETSTSSRGGFPDTSLLLFWLASMVATLCATTATTTLLSVVATVTGLYGGGNDVASNRRRRANDASNGGVFSSALVENVPLYSCKVLDKGKPNKGNTSSCDWFLHGVRLGGVLV